MAILTREKILSLDHPVATLPHVQVKHLLSHTTGIPKVTTDTPAVGFNALIERGMPPIEVYKKVSETTADALPAAAYGR